MTWFWLLLFGAIWYTSVRRQQRERQLDEEAIRLARLSEVQHQLNEIIDQLTALRVRLETQRQT